MSKSALLLAATVAAATTAVASDVARADDNSPKIVVHYSEGSLGSADGVTDLYRRIVSASKKVCPDAAMGDFAGHQRSMECRQHAVAEAVQQIHNVRFAETYGASAKSG